MQIHELHFFFIKKHKRISRYLASGLLFLLLILIERTDNQWSYIFACFYSQYHISCFIINYYFPESVVIRIFDRYYADLCTVSHWPKKSYWTMIWINPFCISYLRLHLILLSDFWNTLLMPLFSMRSSHLHTDFCFYCCLM